MQSRLLIINCPSKYFCYIPVGTFGLCDYLNRKDIPARILNLALYKEHARILKQYLESFKPTHVGLILHWQETVEGFLSVGERVKSFKEDVKIIAGGFTAGYFGKNLLQKCRFVDFVVKGDPERPMEFLLNGVTASEVPNVIYWSPSGIKSNGSSYFVDQDTLSAISFSELTYLHDHELYIEAIERKLGFPIFVGRGCVHGCRYCGGSCSAFRSHSKRVKPVTRTVDAIVADLKRIKDFTRKIYLCYENDRGFAKSLFNAMKMEEPLKKAFHLNYGAWQLPDAEFLESYRELFVPLGDIKPVLELSPEVFDDGGRKRIKKASVCYSMEELRENLELINNHLGDQINISVFFSRYHETAKTYSDMKREIAGIFRFKHDLFCGNLINVKVSYDHLSTDVASRYWDDYVKQPKDFDTLRTSIRRIGGIGFPVDNLCVYFPETLSEDEILRCELLIFTLKTLEKYSHEMLHILFKCLDDLIIDIFEDIIVESYSKRSDDVFASFEYSGLFNLLRQKIVGDESLLERIPFIQDLINLNNRKIKLSRQSVDLRADYQKRHPKLNNDLISVHEHDYFDLQNFLKRLDNEGSKHLRPEKTVYIFLADEILAMPCETYELTLKQFERGISVNEYFDLMKKKGIFTPSHNKGLINKLLLNRVLL